MKICVVGTGSSGLVISACLSDFGMEVVAVDTRLERIEGLRRGELPVYEPGLREYIEKNVAAGRLSFSDDLALGTQGARAVFIADRADSSADSMRQVATLIGRRLEDHAVVVVTSSAPPGACALVEEVLEQEAGPERSFAVVSNPEFLREGAAIADFMEPRRVILGSRDPHALETMLEIYAPLKRANLPFVITTVENAELIKYASNTFLAGKVSFMNEIARLCEVFGADVEQVAQGMGLDQRIGAAFLRPGPGFGGSTLPRNARALSRIARDQGMSFRIAEAIVSVNASTEEWISTKIQRAFGGLEGKTVAALGLSFKPETDDVRHSPAVAIVEGLLAAGAEVRAFDPAAMPACRELLPQVDFAADPYEAAEGADGVVILTEWNLFRHLDLSRLRQLLRTPLIVDLRNIYDPAKVAAAGHDYVSVGRRDFKAGSN